MRGWPARGAALLGAVLAGGGSGAAVVAAGPPDGLPALLFVALVPLLVAAAGGGAWRAAIAGGVCGAVVYAVGVPWLAHTAERLQGVSPGVAAALAVVFIAYHQVPYALNAVAARALLFRAPPAGAACGVAAAWVLVEWAFPMLLPWTIGSLLGPAAALRQAAALGGPFALTFLVVLVNALLAAALLVVARDVRRAARLTLGAAIVAGAAWGGGRLALAGRGASGPIMRVAAVQGTMPAQPADPAAGHAQAWATYASLTLTLGERADLVVWPESTLRVPVRDNPTARRRVEELAAAIGAPLLFGGQDRGTDGAAMNGALLVAAQPGPARWEPPYHKLRLVPFAEHVPWVRGLLPGWRTTGALTPGTERRTMAIRAAGGSADGGSVDRPGGTATLAPAICFEAIVPGWFNALVADGAEVLVNLTDDAWFDDPRAAAQHLEMTRLRAVETRRWLVRASNSGVSAIIDPYGEIVASLRYGERGVLEHPVERCRDVSLYVRGGEWVVAASALMLLLLAASQGLAGLRPGRKP